ncbi:MAG TPA: methylthioribulose 1-phosphate dehydratase [Thermoanaerobaculia bacterium]|jgi:methylthioribulose-1-phosphate dehydratase
MDSLSNPGASVAARLVETGLRLERRGWALGTSGNFSAVLAHDPLRLAITASGIDKASLAEKDIVEVDERAQLISPKAKGDGRPSAEAHLHIAVVKARGAGAVLHTHSVWNTVLTEADAAESGEISIRGYEMLKGLAGVRTHEHEERVPIVENTQDIPKLAREVEAMLAQRHEAHAFLIRRHGLYTWGSDLSEAVRHVEILEFLFEVLGRSRATKTLRD